MKPRIAHLATTLALLRHAKAGVAPAITTIEEGYNVIAKIPCLGCPFLFQDTSKGTEEPWTERTDDNALLLNVSLPYNSAFIAINNAELYAGRRNLPRIYANQVVQDYSEDELAKVVASNQLEASHETNLGGGFFGLSYTHSLRRIKTSQSHDALLFQFDVTDLYSGLLEPPLKHRVADPNQSMLEIILLEEHLMSSMGPAPTFEMLEARLVPRSQNRPSASYRPSVMHFLDWDDYGEKGTAAHALSYSATSLVEWIASGFWGLFLFILGTIFLFVLVCLLCIFGWGFWQDDYEKAQHGKHRGTKSRGSVGSGSWRTGDVEMAKGRFKSAEELGLMGRGKVVGLGKSD